MCYPSEWIACYIIWKQLDDSPAWLWGWKLMVLLYIHTNNVLHNCMFPCAVDSWCLYCWCHYVVGKGGQLCNHLPIYNMVLKMDYLLISFISKCCLWKIIKIVIRKLHVLCFYFPISLVHRQWAFWNIFLLIYLCIVYEKSDSLFFLRLKCMPVFSTAVIYCGIELHSKHHSPASPRERFFMTL